MDVAPNRGARPFSEVKTNLSIGDASLPRVKLTSLHILWEWGGLMKPIDRRQFAGMLAALGIPSDRPAFAVARSEGPEVLRLTRNGWMPNNEKLPILIYPDALAVTGEDPATTFENAFERNGWAAAVAQRSL